MKVVGAQDAHSFSLVALFYAFYAATLVVNGPHDCTGETHFRLWLWIRFFFPCKKSNITFAGISVSNSQIPKLAMGARANGSRAWG